MELNRGKELPKKKVIIGFLVLLLFFSLASISKANALNTPQYIPPQASKKQEKFTPSVLAAYVSTHSWIKRYKNLFGIVVASQEAVVQWNWNSSTKKITKYGKLWQDNWTAILYSFSKEKNSWNFKNTTKAQTNQSVKFSSGVPTPWGNVKGSSFTSRILITVNGSGRSSAN